MATAKAVPTLAVPGLAAVPTGQTFLVYEKGVDAFDRLRTNGDVELVLDDGSKTTAKVQAIQVAPLIDLIANNGSMAGAMVGRIYSPLALVQTLTDQDAGKVLDVTKLYAGVTVMVPYEVPGPMPTGV